MICLYHIGSQPILKILPFAYVIVHAHFPYLCISDIFAFNSLAFYITFFYGTKNIYKKCFLVMKVNVLALALTFETFFKIFSFPQKIESHGGLDTRLSK